MAPRVLVVHEQTEVEAAEVAGAEAEGEARPRPRQTLLDRPRPVALPRYEVRTGVPGCSSSVIVTVDSTKSLEILYLTWAAASAWSVRARW